MIVAAASTFVNLALPNPTVWFYFSALLAIALFFKFARLFSIRNLDILTLFLFMPGLLLLAESQGNNLAGFAWLLGASGYFFARCLFDLGLTQRPVLSPNLSLGGLFWLGGTLFASLLVVPPGKPPTQTAESGDQPKTEVDRTVTSIGKEVARLQPVVPVGKVDDTDLGLLVQRALALMCHLSIVVGLVLIGRKHFQDVEAGAAAAVMYLLLPYTFLLLPNTPLETSLKAGRWDHAWPMAWMVWSVYCYRRPVLGGAFLGIAAGMIFPVVVLPVWLGFYWKRGVGRFVFGFVLTASLCLLGSWLFFREGVAFRSLQSSWNQSTWQPWQAPPGEARSAWVGVHWAYRMPVFIAYLTFVATTMFWPRPKNLAHVLALTTAVLIGIQFWYADQGGVYVLWYLPFLLLLVFRPNLSACLPPIPAETWLTRLCRRVVGWLPSCAARRKQRRRRSELAGEPGASATGVSLPRLTPVADAPGSPVGNSVRHSENRVAVHAALVELLRRSHKRLFIFGFHRLHESDRRFLHIFGEPQPRCLGLLAFILGGGIVRRRVGHQSDDLRHFHQVGVVIGDLILGRRHLAGVVLDKQLDAVLVALLELADAYAALRAGPKRRLHQVLVHLLRREHLGLLVEIRSATAPSIGSIAFLAASMSFLSSSSSARPTLPMRPTRPMTSTPASIPDLLIVFMRFLQGGVTSEIHQVGAISSPQQFYHKRACAVSGEPAPAPTLRDPTHILVPRSLGTRRVPPTELERHGRGCYDQRRTTGRRKRDEPMHAEDIGTPVSSPRVFLVGAGPGNPGLLTLRAVECLGRADLVLYDQLVSPRLLDFAPPSARRVCVTELHEHHVERVPLVSKMLIEAAQAGQCVVRLKGGDPYIFGRGAEDGEMLRRAGILFEVVPGITAAIGAGAFAGIPLTHRHHASAVAFVTGHEEPGKSDPLLDWSALARFPGTLVVYMGVSRLRAYVQALLDHGKPADTPAALVHRAATGRQRTIVATLAQLPDAAQGITSPSLVIIGAVVQLRPVLNWFEQRPLFGKHVLVTRPRHQAAAMAHRLEELGAEVTLLPTVEVREPEDWALADRAIGELDRYQWLIFTSANGVHFFIRRLRHCGRDLRALGALRLAVIGPATAEALRSYHLEPDLMPAEFRSEALADALRASVAGQRILLARADRGREVLREQLAEVAEVEQVAVYSQVDTLEIDPQTAELLRQGAIQYVTLTSSNIVRSLVRLVDAETLAKLRDGTVQLVSISPVTSAAIRELGLPVAAEAEEYTTEGVIAALVKLVVRRG